MEQKKDEKKIIIFKKKTIIVTLLIILIGMILMTVFINRNNREKSEPVTAYEQEKSGDITLLPQKAIERNDIVIATDGVTGTINPLIAVLEGDRYASRMVYESLVEAGTDGSPIPQLAEKWEISEDGKTYTFTLKPDICFSDGTAVTLEDVQASVTAFCDSSIDSEYTKWVNFLSGYEAYRNGTSNEVVGIAINEDKISFTFVRPHFSNIWSFLIPIQKKEALEYTIGNAASHLYEGQNREIGTGPYRFSRMRETSIELERNENYWGNKAAIELVYLTNSNPAIVVEEFETGVTDLYSYKNIQDTLLPLAEEPSVSLYSYEGNITGYIGINCRRWGLDNIKVRQALAYGMNRSQIVEEIFGNSASVPLSVYYDKSWIMPKDYNGYNYNKDTAEAILEEEGYIKGDDGIRMKGSKRLSFTLVVNEASIYADAANKLAENLKEIGIEIQIKPVDYEQLVNTVYEEREFDLYYGYINNGLEPMFGTQFIGKEDNNTEGWWNEDAALLLDEAEDCWDFEKRKAIYQQWMKIYNDEMPQIPINSTKYFTAASVKINQVEPNVFRTPYQDIQNYIFAE